MKPRPDDEDENGPHLFDGLEQKGKAMESNELRNMIYDAIEEAERTDGKRMLALVKTKLEEALMWYDKGRAMAEH